MYKSKVITLQPYSKPWTHVVGNVLIDFTYVLDLHVEVKVSAFAYRLYLFQFLIIFILLLLSSTLAGRLGCTSSIVNTFQFINIDFKIVYKVIGFLLNHTRRLLKRCQPKNEVVQSTQQ